MVKLPHTKSCFVCGVNNPLGLRLDFETDGEMVRARYAPRPEHSGFKEAVHGGLLFTVLDEAMVWAVGVRGKRFFYFAGIGGGVLGLGRPHGGVTPLWGGG